MVAISNESGENQLLFANAHQDSACSIKVIKESDWTEFMDIVYNDGSNVEVERVDKFPSPTSAFQFSPFISNDDQRDDDIQNTFPNLPEEYLSAFGTAINSQMRDSFVSCIEAKDEQKDVPSSKVQTNPSMIQSEVPTNSRMKKKKGLTTKPVPQHVVCEQKVMKCKENTASKTYSPIKGSSRPPSSNHMEAKSIKDRSREATLSQQDSNSDSSAFNSDKSSSISSSSRKSISASSHSKSKTSINREKTNDRASTYSSTSSNPSVSSKSIQVVRRKSTQQFIAPKGMATRSLVTASVYHNQATGLWITTINTNQHQNGNNSSDSSKYLKAFSLHSEREARESAYAYAPPKMWPSDSQSTCFSCDTNFTMFKRASNCRNCGACVCSSCFIFWNKSMIPETYNNNDENSIKICKSCDILSISFRQALMEGNYEDVISIYNTGNVNLRCPFMNVKGAEVMFPIHCAIFGGNLDIIVWLIDVHFCPIKSFRSGNKYGEHGSDEQLITTSKGRNVLDIALERKNIETLRYLVCDKNVSVFGVKDLSSLIGAFDVAMKALGPLSEDGLAVYEDNVEHQKP